MLQTYSPTHRPRANGRAEKAGSQLLSILKKLHIEYDLNWVEALPRALRLHHDVTGEAGLSPYHIMFGRDGNPPGIIYTPERFCENSFQYFKRMEHIDHMIFQELNSIHAKESKRRNSNKPSGRPIRLMTWSGF